MACLCSNENFPLPVVEHLCRPHATGIHILDRQLWV